MYSLRSTSYQQLGLNPRKNNLYFDGEEVLFPHQEKLVLLSI